MNREIKFRAWNIKDNKWVDDFMISPDGAADIYDDEDGGKSGLWEHSEGIWKDLELVEYTGLKDKNGKVIFEGDLVKGHWSPVILQVIYQAPSFVMKQRTKSGTLSKSWCTFDIAPSDNQLYEVIGNIYENPELLEATK